MEAKDERQQLELVMERLSIKFNQLPGEVVAGAVREAEAGMRSASIRDFVPVLVEKEARDWLAAELVHPHRPRDPGPLGWPGGAAPGAAAGPVTIR